MAEAQDSYLRAHPLRWLIQACLLGATTGAFVGAAVSFPSPRGLGTSAMVGIILSLVMWGGFELFLDPFRPRTDLSPEQVGLRAVLWMLGLYLVLLALSMGLVKLLTGVNLLLNRGTMIITSLAGMAVSGFIATKETIAKVVEAERRLAQSEARASFLSLQAQLQPHTLFNSLNTIAALIPEEPKRAEEATERLSALLRRILGALEKPAWPLREEFELLEDLLRLEALRFGGRLTFTLDLDQAMADREVPPLLLLPLVENSLKHGFRPKIGPCALSIVAKAGRISIVDDGVGRTGTTADGLGLRTVRERLEALGGTLVWPSVSTGCGVEVSLP